MRLGTCKLIGIASECIWVFEFKNVIFKRMPKRLIENSFSGMHFTNLHM
jgi:hypothetical protein